KVVEWLSDINYHAIQSDNLRKRAEGTGEWVFDDPKISSWLEGVMGILWGVGMPGAGKTILAYIVHLLEKAKANKRICVAFAFCRYTDQFTGEKVLGGLLRQVIEDHPSTLQYAKPMYDYHSLRKTRPAQKELLAVLRAIFTSDLFDERYCTIDGLDEALADTQIDVLDALSNMPVNFLIMSRPLPLLKELVPEATFIDVIVHDADIEQIIEEKLRRTMTLRNILEKEDWRETVLKTVVEKSSGMFLLASLQLDMLGRCLHTMDLRSALDVLPVGVNAMYEATMERIKGCLRPQLALQALTWLIYARESLEMDDLRHALAVDMETFVYRTDCVVDAETLLSICCGLITFEPKTRLVRLVHYTAHDFLVTYLSNAGVDAQVMLACTCVAHLRACGFEHYDGEIYYYGEDVFISQPFLAYAHCNWVLHAQSSSFPVFVEEFMLQCQRFPWYDPWSETFDFVNSIQLAAANNFYCLLVQWLEMLLGVVDADHVNAKESNTGGGEGDSALTLAAYGGHLDAVKLLLGVNGINVNASHWKDGTALAQASGQGHKDIVKLLLQQEDIDINFSQCTVGTALMQAAYWGHTDVVKLLLQQEEIDVNATRNDGESALAMALERNEPEIAELLQSHGAQ
ncbi:ankyrin, partial [Coprinopsis marcescibilis]